MRSHVAWLVVLWFSLAPGPSVPSLAAQDAPKRPRLGAGADTNSAELYYRHGLKVLETGPKEAAAAFYWATRLEPGWAEALYARRVAEIRADSRGMVRWFRGDARASRTRDAVRRDSLLIRAWAINPFLSPALDPGLIRHALREGIEAEIRRSDPSLRSEEFQNEITFAIRQVLASDASLATRAWIAFGEGRYPDALTMYARLLEGKHSNPFLHDDRATVLFLTGDFAGAEAELSHAIADLQEQKKTTNAIYQSKAMLAMKKAMALARSEKIEEAKVAVQEALVEDLAFYPAHLILGNIALLEADTALALREYQMAAELVPGEPQPQIQYATLLLATGQPKEAAVVLTSLTSREPLFAAGHRMLGECYRQLGNAAMARVSYAAFLSHAALGDPAREDVDRQLRQIDGAP